MKQIISITFKSILRDRVFHGICFVSFLFLMVPSLSSLSMRQGAELSITICLSLISFVLLLLSVFLGGTSIWRNQDRKYTYSVLSLPMSRTAYVTGTFLGVVLFLLLITIVLGSIAAGAVWVTSFLYPPDRPINWANFSLAVFFQCLKYVLLTACAIFFSTFSTSFFLPVFGSLSIFFVGNAMQQVYEYANSPGAAELGSLLKGVVGILYYVLPNFSAFDLQVYAIYGVQLPVKGVVLTIAYFFVYTLIVMTISSIVFRKREIK